MLAFRTDEVLLLYALTAVTVTLYCVDAVRPPIVHGDVVHPATVDGVDGPYCTRYELAPGIAAHDIVIEVCDAELSVGDGVFSA